MRDTDSAVFHREAQQESLLFPLLAHDQHHLSVIGKLNGIPYQIHDDLTQPSGVPNHVLGNLGVYLKGQFQALLMGAQG